MSKQNEINHRVIMLADNLEAGFRGSELIKEYAQKWGCTCRTVERYIALARNITEARQNNYILSNPKEKIPLTEIKESLFLGVLERVYRLTAIARGQHEAEKVVYSKGEPKTIVCKPNIKEQMQAIKDLRKEEESFSMIAKEHPEIFERLEEVTENLKTAPLITHNL